MRSRVELGQHLLSCAHDTFGDNLIGLTLEEALWTPPGGYRSVLGTIKHAAAWCHVYRSFAFDPQPKGWTEIDWPRGLRDTIELTPEYLAEVITWFKLSHELWMRSMSSLSEEDVDLPRPLHWGQQAPLYDIVVMIAHHHVYHAGEINQLLAIKRGEAWEEYEEVEENHISTVGHRVRPAWV